VGGIIALAQLSAGRDAERFGQNAKTPAANLAAAVRTYCVGLLRGL